jgi:hypothetical protein
VENVVETQGQPKKRIDETDRTVLLYEGTLGSTPATVGYMFNANDELCIANYEVKQFDTEKLAKALNEGKNDPSAKRDINISAVTDNVLQSLVDKYGTDYRTSGDLALWSPSERLTVMAEGTEFYLKIYYLYPSCARKLLPPELADAIYPDKLADDL